MWCFPLVFVGFGILAGMWPFHTWAPTGHVAAPTAASMLLAGVVMKLGAYGCLRVGIGLFPHGLDPWGFSFSASAPGATSSPGSPSSASSTARWLLSRKPTFKFVIGYSSVSHMGFVLLGLMTLNQIGVDGAVLQMFSHGIIAGLLFAIVGRVVYDRTHTRQFAELEPMHLSRRLPFAAWAFVFAGIASMGLPGFSGFVAELQVLVGAWQANPWWTIVSGIGIIVGVAYIWRALQKAFFSDTLPTAHELEAEQQHKFAPITWPEITGVALLGAARLLSASIRAFCSIRLSRP
jgi:NADH-quinone oxidoreductase subunit M